MPSHFPTPTAPVVLRDGSTVLIRAIRPDDASLLADGFARLSPRSRRSRFLMTKRELSAAELRHLTDVDHHDHEAIAAANLLDGRGVGIARYVRDRHDRQTAEVAVTVVDDWQGRGLGTVLLRQLAARAGTEGIRRFSGLMEPGNVAAARLLRGLATDVKLVDDDPDYRAYVISLPARVDRTR